MTAMAVELDGSSDAIEDFLAIYNKNKLDIDTTAVIEEDLALIGYEEFPKTVKAAFDRIEPLFVKVSERSSR